MRCLDDFAAANESVERWVDTNARLTHVVDLETDIFDLFIEAPWLEVTVDWLVHGRQARPGPQGQIPSAPALV